jgi:hypothetical protein
LAEVSIAWGTAYADWLAARAAMAKCSIEVYATDPTPEDQDAQYGKVNDVLTAAEHRLIDAQATEGWQLLQKFEALQTMLLDREREGRPSDDRHLKMLASFHLDLMHFRLVGGADA